MEIFFLKYVSAELDGHLWNISKNRHISDVAVYILYKKCFNTVYSIQLTTVTSAVSFRRLGIGAYAESIIWAWLWLPFVSIQISEIPRRKFLLMPQTSAVPFHMFWNFWTTVTVCIYFSWSHSVEELVCDSTEILKVDVRVMSRIIFTLTFAFISIHLWHELYNAVI